MRACRDHPYRIRDCAACQAANPPLTGLRPFVDADGLVTFRALQPVELLEEIVGWVEGEVQA
ncbi:MAG: hypothetical protein ABIS21_08330 [Acidimicrobiales bacterium]